MRILLPIIVICGLVLFACNTPPAETSEEQSVHKAFDIHRGLNISHWLSQSKTRGEDRRNYFTESDVAAVAAAGFDHIRIPIDEEQMWDSLGNKEPEAFELLHNALQWMAQHKLKALVDLHIIRSHHFLDDSPPLFSDPAEAEKFAELWAQLSGELNRYPNSEVAYELLNESVAEDHEDWNRVFRGAYDKVRSLEPERVIFLGPNRWQNVRYFPHLKVPADDPNIVLSFHFYIPHPVTHYKASWTDIRDYEGPIQYPGIPINPADTAGLDAETREAVRKYTTSAYNPSKFRELMNIAVSMGDSLELQVYCGEFGAYAAAPEEIRFRWFKDVVGLFEENGIAWSAWDLKSGSFGILNPDDDMSLRVPKKFFFNPGPKQLKINPYLIQFAILTKKFKLCG